MTFEKIEVVLMTLLFVVPGFIISTIFSACKARKTQEKELLLLRFLSFSTLNFTIALPVILSALKTQYILFHPLRSWLGFLLITFCLPFVLGCLVAWIDKSCLFNFVLKILGLNPMEPIPNAWDYKFERAKGQWMLITMLDGEQFQGYFGEGAIASSDPSERDIYLKEVFVVKRGGHFIKNPGSDGILITKDKIKHIQFVIAKTKDNKT